MTLLITLATQFFIILIQIAISESYGEPCLLEDLHDKCKENEACRSGSSSVTEGVCQCFPGYFEYPANESCIGYNPEPVPPSEHSSAVAVGISVSILIGTVIVIIGLLQYRYKVLNGMFHFLYRIRRRAERGQQVYEVADNEDDVDPIV